MNFQESDMGHSWNKRRLQRASAIGALFIFAILVLAYHHPLPLHNNLFYYLTESRYLTICIENISHYHLKCILSENNLLDGCYHVYLDVGSNIGVQVRKLFQPKEYPGAGAIKVFREAFGE